MMENPWVWFGIAVGLAMDAFALAVATSLAMERVTGRHVFRFAFHFGLFQAVMPIIGWFLGSSISQYIQRWDHWIAFFLLVGVGGKTLYDAFKKDEPDEADSPAAKDPTRGWTLIIYSVATSIDALAVGLSVAMVNDSIWLVALMIGAVTCTLTTVGMLLAARLGWRLGEYAEMLGGGILITIAFKILFSHIF